MIACGHVVIGRRDQSLGPPHGAPAPPEPGQGRRPALVQQVSSRRRARSTACRRGGWSPNQLLLLPGALAHGPARELQMATRPVARATTPTRMPLWSVQELRTLPRTLFVRAGGLTRPHGKRL